jgi:SOS-response transcriptional repressor LexA
MRKQLTSKQDEVLRALVLFVRKHRRQPSVKELSAIVGSKNVQRHLLELELRGWIKSSGKPRAIEIPEDVYECIVETGEVPIFEHRWDDPRACFVDDMNKFIDRERKKNEGDNK